MPKISELTLITDEQLTDKDVLPIVDKNAAGDIVVDTKGVRVDQLRKIKALDVTLANIATNTVQVTGAAWGVTTDGHPVFLPPGGASVDTGTGVDWIYAYDLIDPATGLIRADKLPSLIIAGLRTGTRAELDAADPPLLYNEPAWESDTQVFRVGSVRFDRSVTASSVTANPGDDLAAKYAEAAALTPGGAPLSHSNRASLIVNPGVYTLAAELAVDTNYVDVLGLGAGEFSPAVELAGNTINVTAWDVRVVGISVGGQAFIVSSRPDITGVTGTSADITITIPNHGFQSGDVVSFSALTGGTGLSTGVRYVVAPFSYTGDAFKLILESTGVLQSFTTDITAGTLVVESNQSQKFDVCTGGDSSFGYFGTASGTFTNCTGSSSSFGCDGTASGTFTNCTAKGSSSFGGGNGTLSGKLYYCRLTSGTFPTVAAGGITRLCLDGNYLENNQG